MYISQDSACEDRSKEAVMTVHFLLDLDVATIVCTYQTHQKSIILDAKQDIRTPIEKC